MKPMDGKNVANFLIIKVILSNFETLASSVSLMWFINVEATCITVTKRQV